MTSYAKGVPPAAARRILPPFAEEHEELRGSLRRFVEAELLPHADEWERERWFPNELFPRMGELGFLGLKYEEEYGGQGGGYLHDAVLAEELARCGSGGVAAGLGAHITIATPPVWKFGTEDQKQRYLVPSIAGDLIAALAITEPDAGSDVAGMKTMAKPVDGGWVLNGSKMFITNGVRADYLVLAAKTTRRGRPRRHLVLPRRHRSAGLRGVEDREARLARVRHGADRARRRLRAGGEPARRAQRRVQADHGQLPVGAAVDGARRGRRGAALLRADARLRAASARRSAARSAASRRSATSSPRWRRRSRRAAR